MARSEAAGSEPSPPEAGQPGAGPSRRDFLRRAGIGSAAVLGGGALGGGVLGNRFARDAEAATTGAEVQPADATAHTDGLLPHDTGSHYGGGYEPPPHLTEDHLASITVPPPAGAAPGGVREVDVTVTERQLLVADGVVAEAWTYNGTVPGPILRVTEGERLRIRLRNRTDRPHNLHLHGRHSPQQDGWEPVPAGGETVYDVVAAPFGLHPYHCHTPPLAAHVARGLYGALIVDPPGGRPPAHEFVLVLSGWDLDGDGRNELYAWNGVAGFFHRYPLKVPVGEPVRCYVLNLLEYEPVGSFHLHAQTFDVLWQGTSTEPDLHADTVTLAQGDRVVVEFTLPERGRYMFHPHQHHLADRGAMGWFAAI